MPGTRCASWLRPARGMRACWNATAPSIASGYNLAAIPLAAAGLLNPLIAGTAMALSSAFVVANSVRLRNFGAPATRRPDWLRPNRATPQSAAPLQTPVPAGRGGPAESKEQAG